MDNDILPQNDHSDLRIDRLMEELEQLALEVNRMHRRRVDEIFLSMRAELPNAPGVINGALANILATDAPYQSTDITLNNMVIILGKILCNPALTQPLAEAIQVYLHARKITEKEYAAEIANDVLDNNSLTIFPESARHGLQDLSLTIMEKIISEKQARKTPGYKSHSILDLVSPYLHYKLANPELERLKVTMPQALRSWIANIGQEGYEKINNPKKFAQVQQEKDAAFNEFKAYLAAKMPNKAALVKLVDKIRLSQADRNKKHDELTDELNDFLRNKSILNQSTREMRIRFHQKLRKLFNHSDQNPDIFRSEEALLAAHEEAFKNVNNDVFAIKKILSTIDTIETNFRKNFIASIFGKSHLDNINAIVLSTLLGPMVKKRETGNEGLRVVREGGYPQKNLNEIYDTLITQLQLTHDTLKGLFSSALKLEIEQGINVLKSTQSGLKIFPDVITVFTKPTLVSATVPTKEAPTNTLVEPEAKIAVNAAPDNFTTPATPAKKEEVIPPSLLKEEFQPQPTPVAASFAPAEEPKPEIKTEAAPLQIDDTFSFEEPKVETKPLAIDDSFSFDEPALEPKPLQIDEAFSFDEPTPEPKPLLIIEDFEDENLTIAEPATNIINNYQLGEFKQAVQDAWKVMTASAKAAAQDDTDGFNMLNEQNTIQMYVICDLAQQIAAIDANRLNPEQKEILQSIRNVLLAALVNPLDEHNWSCFEGTRRDDIDRAIARLQQ